MIANEKRVKRDREVGNVDSKGRRGRGHKKQYFLILERLAD